MNRMSPSPMVAKLAPMTRAERKKLKLQENNDMLVYMMEALRRKFDELEDRGKNLKLFTMCVKDQSKKQIGEEIG